MPKITQPKKATLKKKTIGKKLDTIVKEKELERQKVNEDSDSESDQEESEEEEIEVNNEQDEDDVIDEDNEAEDEDIDNAKKEEDEEADGYDEEDNCIYDINDDEDEDNVDDELNIEEEIDPSTENVFVAPEDRRTPAVLFSFERTRVIGDRAQLINLGAKRGIKNSEHLAPHEVAELELQHNMIPLLIIRPLENGKKELWKLSELAH